MSLSYSLLPFIFFSQYFLKMIMSKGKCCMKCTQEPILSVIPFHSKGGNRS